MGDVRHYRGIMYRERSKGDPGWSLGTPQQFKEPTEEEKVVKKPEKE